MTLLLLVFLMANPLAAATVWITNVSVVDMTGRSPRGPVDVEIRDGRIHGIHRTAARKGVDGTGKFLIPALWDSHVHLARLRPVLPMLFAHGVLHVRDMGSPVDQVQAIRSEAKLGIRTPGPMIDGPPSEPGPIFRILKSPVDAASAIPDGVDFVKVQQNLSRDAFVALIQAAKIKRLPVEGHVPDAVDIREAARLGQRSMEHLTGVLVASSAREAEIRALVSKGARMMDFGPLGEAARLTLDFYDQEKARELFQLLRQKNVAIVPTLAWEDAYLHLDQTVRRTDERWRYVPAAMRRDEALKRASDRRSPEIRQLYDEYWKKALSALSQLHAAGVSVLAGTDQGDEFTLPGVALHRELELLVSAGLTPMQALQSATRDAARFAGAGRTHGTVEKGRTADLLLLDANPLDDIRNSQRITAVIRNGEVFARPDLDRMLSSLRP